MVRKCVVGIVGILVALLIFPEVHSYGSSESKISPEAEMRTLYSPGDSGENPTILKSRRGFINFLSVGEGGVFEIGKGKREKTQEPANTFLNFVKENSSAFTNLSQDSQFEVKQVLKSIDGNSLIVKLNQRIGDFQVFGAEVVGKVTQDGKLLSLGSKILEDLTEEEVSIFQNAPPVTPELAKERAVLYIQEMLDGKGDSVSGVIVAEQRYLFVPSLLKVPGAVTIVYSVEVNTIKGNTYIVLVDVFTGEVRLWYPIRSGLKNRTVYDANSSYAIPTIPAREEGGEPSGIAEVDNAYDYLGDAYDFFYTYHNLDSYDGNGSEIRAVVRLPVQNAYYDSRLKLIGLGSGFVVDDVVGHEYAHAVIDSLTDLVYFGEPGAIIESYCDVWGEFIDLTNARGLDSPSVRWLIGEELPSVTTWEGSSVSPVRSLANPPAYKQPDRYNSELFVKLTTFEVEDFGGVHTNSGVGNKLAYLLAEGGNFNGERVEPFGIPRTSKLFFGALELLPALANYEMLALALNASAIAQGFTLEQRFNLSSALRAVEILPAELLQNIKINFRATPLVLDDGSPVVLLSWTPPPQDQYSRAFLLRKVTGFPANPVDGEKVYEGKGNYYIDVNVSTGIEYYYVLFVEMAQLPPIEAYDSAVAGEEPSPVWTQEFKPVYPRGTVAEELQYSQIMFIPTGAPVNPLGGNKYIGSFTKYDAKFIPEVFSLPVMRDSATGSVYSFSIATDGLVSYTLTDVEFPFFGKKYSTFYIGGNGYIAFAPVALDSADNFPTLESHFAVPRISFLFSDLAPDTGGEVWIKRMDDRIVITFDRVPKNNAGGPPNPYTGGNPGSTIQVELFYSGHIRITYLQLDPNYTIVGLSDGRGVPVDPSSIISEIPRLNRYVDFISLPGHSEALSIDPLPVFFTLPNQSLIFEARVTYTGVPVPYLSAQWLRSEIPPFSDLRNGRGRFSWTPTLSDTGNYYLRILAQQGSQFAYQDVRINVNPVEVKPQAVNLRISSLSPAEDTSATRMVSAGRPLVASYNYIHPWMTTDPAKYAEGLSILYWFRNHEVIGALTNYRTVPANVTRGGDVWYFRVIPVTISGIVGDEVMSPVIYVVDNPTITQIVPNRGKTTGGEPVRIRGKGFLGILSIKFGGVPVVSYKAITEEEIEVITPQHQVGTVDVYIQTVGGFTNLPQAFEYYEEQQPTPEPPPEKSVQILCCGKNNSRTTGSAINMIDLLFLGIVIAFALLASKRYNSVDNS
ncbi:MAG: M4 family metallopeptidase [Candidatus Hydrogenedentes bacterium]|nr:M4 family metallopeptidase [Candidatus Hydrogenedentota bacterium]